MGCLVGVVNSKKLSSSKLFSTDFGQKVTDQPRIFPAASAAQWPQTSKIHPVCAAPNVTAIKYALKIVL